jgi:flagellar biosynthetic protein FliQ
MTLDQVSDLFRQTVQIVLIVSAPMLLVAMGAGLLISILQAATQVNEQTLTFVPKIVLVLGLFGLLFPWIMGTITDFGMELFARIAAGGAGP